MSFRLSLLCLLLMAPAAGAATFNPGDLVVSDVYGSSLLRVDPVSGASSLIATGGLLEQPRGVAVDRFGQIFVADAVTGIVRINPFTGGSQVVASGGYLDTPGDLVFDTDGSLLVAAENLVRVNPNNGQQTLIESGLDIHTIAWDTDGSLFLSGVHSPFRDDPGLFDYDLSTGAISVLTRLSIWGAARHPNGDVLAATPIALHCDFVDCYSALNVVDPTVLNDLALLHYGDSRSVVVAPDGTVFYTADNDVGYPRGVTRIEDVADPYGTDTFFSLEGLLAPDAISRTTIRDLAFAPTQFEPLPAPGSGAFLLAAMVLGFRRLARR